MRRRAMLGALGSGIAVLAGCSGRSEPQSAGTAPPETTAPGTAPPDGTEASPTPTERIEEETPGTADAADLRLLSVGAPSEVQVGESARYRFTVENAGEEPRSVAPAVDARWGASTWTRQDDWEPVELAPGGRHTFESGTFTSEYLRTVRLRISGFEPVVPIEFVERRLRIPGSYRDVLGREVGVDDVSFESSYTYNEDGSYRVVSLDGNVQFVFAEVDVVNRTDGPLTAPDPSTFTLLAGDETHHAVPMLGDAGYEAKELQWGSRSSGRVAFKTDGSISTDEVQVRWVESLDEGDVGAVWTPR